MRKLLLAVGMAAATLVPATSAMATNNSPNPQDPCAPGRNPTTLCGDLSVGPATPEQCPNGGIVITIGQQSFPVCNGAPGSAGANGTGTPGAAGVAGQTGAAGTTTTITQVVQLPPKNCRSRRILSVLLPGRFKSGQHVRVTVGGQTVRALVVKGRVKVSLVGRKCGVYGIAFRRHGVEAFKRLYVAGPAGNVTAYNVPLPRR